MKRKVYEHFQTKDLIKQIEEGRFDGDLIDLAKAIDARIPEEEESNAETR